MALSPGTRLGPYEIVALIGEGGMGQVYRATDTTLGREVAIKLLPEAFAADAERLARFEREAKTLAALNHPHIAAIYGFEKSAPSTGSGPAGQHALVMELVEGEDLSVLIARYRHSAPAAVAPSESASRGATASGGGAPRAIEIDDALSIAKQIADALEAAHAQGIIHRDLKPANIKVRPDGTVKVLDFGLAKALEPVGTMSASASMSPTITSPAMTHAGVILGTAAYMSPEQARGRIVDKRADIWAFGAVFFEMLTGVRAFPGEDITDTLAAVVRAEPEWGLLPSSISPTLAVFLRRCLQKDPRQRIGDIHDVRLALDGAFDVTLPQAAASSPPPAPGSRLAWIVATTALVAAAALAIPTVRHLTEDAPDAATVHVAVPTPAGSDVGFLALSPDGRRLALGLYRDSKTLMYLRSLDSAELRQLAGTEGVRTPFWSPDSRFIGFFAQGALRVIPAAGGPARVLCTETGLGGGGTWNASGVILFGGESGPLRRVATDAEGAPCTTVGKEDPNANPRFPVFLPDGNHFLYLGGVSGDIASRGVYLAGLDDPAPHRILADYSSAVYASPRASGERAHLLFLRDTTLMAQPFDEATRAAVGDPVPVAPDVGTTFTAPQVAAGASNTTLVYVAGDSTESQLTWFDREGKAVGTVGPRATHVGVVLTADGTAVLTSRRGSDGASSRWLYDIVRGSESRFLPPEAPATSAVWFPDASRVLFGMPAVQSTRGVYQKDPRDGSPPEIVLPLASGSSFVPSSFSRDGRFLAYTSVDPKTLADVWVMPWTDKPDISQATRLVGTSAMESQGQISPDGKWLAYMSAETGEGVVYIRPLSGPGVWRVDRGLEPRWSADGKTLYFKRSLERRRSDLMAAVIEVDGKGNVRPGLSTRLFTFPSMTYVAQNNVFTYSPHPDGQRFLINALTKVDDQPVVTLVTNWQKTIAGR